MNIFIVGDLRSAYRTDFYLQALMQLGYKKIYINSFDKNKIIGGIVGIVMLLLSDVVFVPPLQHNNKLIKWAIFFKKKIVVDFYISFYDSVVFDYKQVDKNSKKAMKFLNIDRSILENAMITTFLNKSERDLYLDRIGKNDGSVNTDIIPLVIPKRNKCAQLNYFKGNSKTMNICWVGTYIPLHGIEKIIEAMKILSSLSLNIHLYLWGNSEKSAKPYIEKVHELGLSDSISFINDKWGDMEAWEDFIVNTCDVSLGVFGNSQKSKTVLPNKVVDGVVFKTPVVTQFSTGLTEFFDLKNDVFACENTPADLAEKIKYIYSLDIEEIESHIEKSYSRYETFLSYDAFYDNVKRIFGKVMDYKYD